jgi:hypothetical protein
MHHKKIHPKISYTTLVLKYIFKFLNSMMNIILSQIYFIHSIFSNFVRFFLKLTNLYPKLIKYTLKRKKIKDVMLIHCKTKLQKD